MPKMPRRERLELARLVLESMPEEDIDKTVSMCYANNYCDMDIRDEFEITKKSLLESRKRIRQMLIDAGVEFDN